MSKAPSAFPRLQVFYGAMWSGKSNALIRAVDQMRLAGQKVTVVKPAIDTRSTVIHARTGLQMEADLVVTQLEEVQLEDSTAYAIDEAQFFSDLLLFWRRILSRPSCSLLVSGLDLDFARQPFGKVLDLSRVALDESLCTLSIERMAALCNYKLGSGHTCGRPAYYSQRLGASREQVVVGDADTYQPACELHHTCDPLPANQWRARRGEHATTGTAAVHVLQQAHHGHNDVASRRKSHSGQRAQDIAQEVNGKENERR